MSVLLRSRNTLIGILLTLCLLVCATAFAQTSAYTYDSLNRLTRVIYTDGTTIIYTYDPAGNRLSMTVNACVFTLSAPSATFTGIGGSGAVDITTTNGCNWTVASNDAFLNITSTTSGSGSGTVAYATAVNNTGLPRIGTLTIAGQTYTVTQSAAFAPAITTNPANVTVTSGLNASFTVVASGNPAPSYQWRVSTNGGATFTDLPEAAPYSNVTAATLTVAAASGLNGYQYRCIATNSVSPPATSTTATLTVNFAPVVSTQPSGTTVTSGSNATFTVVVNANPAPTYQWQASTDGGATFTDLTNAVPYSNVTTPALTVVTVSNLNGAQYRVVATNSLSSTTSSAATLGVNFAPAITSQPTNQTVTSGSNMTFTVAASGNPAPAYQWQVSTNGGSTFTDLANAAPYSNVTTAALTIAATAGLNGNQYRAVATNTIAPPATSTAATLTVNVAPAFTTQPSNATVTSGTNATFTVAASGSPAPAYQWQVSTNGGSTFTNLTEGAPYTNVTSTTLTVAATAGLSGYQFRCVATNVVAAVNSNAATLTVNTAPAFTTQPTNATVTSGTNATFTVAANGTPAPTYQWQVSTNGGGTFTNLTEGAPYTNVTSATLTVAASSGLNGYQFRSVATNAVASTNSTAATLTVNTAPVFTTQPSNATVTSGTNANFTVAASGNPAPTYQWQVSTNGGSTFADLTEGAPYTNVTSTTLKVATTAPLTGYQFRCVATNVVASTNSTAATLTVNTAPAFTTQPSNQTVTSGTNATFTVAASGSPAPTYQWQVSTNGGSTFTNLTEGAPYSGVTSTTLTVAATAGLSGYQFRSVAINVVASTNSNAATLTVNTAPAFTTQPSNATVTSGTNANFTVAASGNPTPTYQWKVSTNGGSTFTNLTEGAPYSGVTSTTLTVAATAGLSGYQFRCVATNSVASTNSNAATLTVNFAPAFTTHPSNATVTSGTNANFTVAASGNPTPTYQWQVSTNGGSTFTNLTEGAPYTNVTSTTLTVAATAGLSGYQFRCVATNVVASTNSNAATLTVNTAPVFTTQPSNATVTRGTNASFTVAASGNPTPTYQWQVSTNGGSTFTNLTNGAPYSNVTTTTLTVAASSGLNAYRYRCVATNSVSSTNSTAATLTVTTSSATNGLVHLNGDSSTDAFVYNASTGNWYRENTSPGGGFSEGSGAWAAGWSISPANFNGDALTDVFVFSTTTGQWYKELNDGAGGFTTQASGVWAPNWQRYVMDLDGDGIDDVFLYDPASGAWYKCISTPTGFNYIGGAWTSGWEIYPMNLNGDALGDMFLFSRTTGQWYWAVGTAGGFTYPQNSYWATDWKLYPGDFNGDGLTDLLLHRPSTGENYVALTGGSGFNYIHGGWITGWTPWVMDLDGDGMSDLFLYNKTTGVWVELLGTGAGTFSQVGGGYWAPGWDLYPADFNGDGRIDWLLYNPTNGQYYQAWNTSNGSFTYYGGNWLSGLSIITGPPIR